MQNASETVAGSRNDLAPGLHHGCLVFLTDAFRRSTVASVAAGLALTSSSHPSQQRKTGFPSIVILTGGPIKPRRLPVCNAQNRCASASLRSAGDNFDRLA